MKTILTGGVLGGLILFVFCTVSWMLLPFHSQSIGQLNNEAAVESLLLQNSSGVYSLPNAPLGASDEIKKRVHEQIQRGPFAFIVFNTKGSGAMGEMMLRGLLTQILAACLVTGLLLKTGGLHYWSRVGFVVAFALGSALICFIPQWNWWGFSTTYILTEIVDLLIAWFLAGLVIAKVTK